MGHPGPSATMELYSSTTPFRLPGAGLGRRVTVEVSTYGNSTPTVTPDIMLLLISHNLSAVVLSFGEPCCCLWGLAGTCLPAAAVDTGLAGGLGAAGASLALMVRVPLLTGGVLADSEMAIMSTATLSDDFDGEVDVPSNVLYVIHMPYR